MGAHRFARLCAAALLLAGSPALAQSYIAPPLSQTVSNGVITTTRADGTTQTLDTGSAAALAAAQSGTTKNLGGVSAAVITPPASGTAPTGATQISPGYTQITSCPTNGAVQLVAGAAAANLSSIYVVDNRTAATCLLYPSSGGQFGSAGANINSYLGPGTIAMLYSLGSTTFQGQSGFHRDWLTQPTTLTPGQVQPGATIPVTVTDPTLKIGDYCGTPTVTAGALPQGLFFAGATSTQTANTITARIGNDTIAAITPSSSITIVFRCSGL